MASIPETSIAQRRHLTGHPLTGHLLTWVVGLTRILSAAMLTAMLVLGMLLVICVLQAVEPVLAALNWSLVLIGCCALTFLFVWGSLVYVYRFRGRERFASVSEYVRKGWQIFTPLNCLRYVMTQRRARRPIMDLAQFRELDSIIANWQTIRDEARQLQQSGGLAATKKPGSPAYYDLGLRTFYNYGWTRDARCESAADGCCGQRPALAYCDAPLSMRRGNWATSLPDCRRFPRWLHQRENGRPAVAGDPRAPVSCSSRAPRRYERLAVRLS